MRNLLCAGLCVASMALELGPGCGIQLTVDEPPVRLAAQDLARDLADILGAAVAVGAAPAVIRIGIDPSLPGPEGHRIHIDQHAIRIDGADALGAVYGVYGFSHRHLGVDPMHRFTLRRPKARAVISLAASEQVVAPPRFRWRGLFINDEDLLGGWRPAAGQRFADWPGRASATGYAGRLLRYYTPVIPPEVMDAVHETLLRLGGNLLIPASFTDVMNPAEAALVTAAVARGLHVSQHHIEPLGVSFTAYESWWARQGVSATFSYLREPERMRAAWRAYAQRWQALAGERVVWQVGLRGRGDRSAWHEDPAFDRRRAGAVIAAAIADQLAILREIDPRPAPPCTLTLWLEVSELVASGRLAVPEGVLAITCDDPAYPGERLLSGWSEGRMGGAYLHAAVWNLGPHLVPGVPDAALARLVDRMAERHETAYLLVNAANIREHLGGLATVLGRGWSGRAPLGTDRLLPPEAAELARRLVAAQGLVPGRPRLSDGRCHRYLTTGDARHLPTQDAGVIAAGAAGLASLADAVDALDLGAADRPVATAAVARPARILAGLWLAVAGRLRGDAAAAVAGIAAAQSACREDPAWYRGDAKVDLSALRQLLAVGPGRGTLEP